MRFLAPFLAALLLAPVQVPVRAASTLPQTSLEDDGPYVLWEGRKGTVLTYHQGKPQEAPLPPGFRLDLPGLPALHLDPAPPRPARAVFPRPGRIAALSDIHGNFQGAVALLQAQGIVDKGLAWTFGKGHLVVAGDMFDRGPQVTETLWLLRSLEQQARAAGGMVHVLLGNHEAMVLGGDLRYLNPKYRALPRPIPELYGPATDLGRWLRSLPVMVKLGDVLFAHGGPSPAFAAACRDLHAANAAARQELSGPGGPMLGPDGPLWYRGLLPGADPGPGATEEEVGRILSTYACRALVVGHTTLERVTAFHGGRVYGIDAGLKDGRPGELWIQVGARHFRGLADGRRVPLD